MLTGSERKPMNYVENLLKVHDIPVIVSNVSTFDTMDRIRRSAASVSCGFRTPLEYSPSAR